MTIKSYKTLKSRVKHRTTEALNYFYNSARHAPPDNIRLLIFAQGRTGSSLLESLICSTKHFCKNGEVLATTHGEILYPIQYIQGLSKRKSPSNVALHVKLYQLTRDRKRPIDPAEFLKTLYHNGWSIVYLKRKNKVKHAISNVIAEHRGTFHKFNNDEEQIRLSIDCKALVRRINERISFEDDERNALANVKYHQIIYEDDLEKPEAHQATVNSVLDYVSLEHRAVITKYRKVNTQALKDLIINYDEFVDCLTSHGWQDSL
jgi:LPS sulfotransferase NodH